MSGTIPSYPKVYSLGHAAVRDIFLGPVLVEEKVDGSQFSFGIIEGALHMRSKGAVIYDATQGGPMGEGSGMFKPAVEYVESISDRLRYSTIYRCEFLGKPKHNTLAYGRAPQNGLVLFDVEKYPDHSFEAPGDRATFAADLGIDVIPSFAVVDVSSPTAIDALMETESFLGGPKIEGVVFKNHSLYGRDGKFLCAKYVSEAFRESNATDWKKRNPKGKDIIGLISDSLRTEARWEKAVQHLRERGELTHSPRDIGPLMKEIVTDVLAECEEEIRDSLFTWAWKDIARSLGRGAPEWYKRRLMESQFQDGDAA